MCGGGTIQRIGRSESADETQVVAGPGAGGHRGEHGRPSRGVQAVEGGTTVGGPRKHMSPSLLARSVGHGRPGSRRGDHRQSPPGQQAVVASTTVSRRRKWNKSPAEAQSVGVALVSRQGQHRSGSRFALGSCAPTAMTGPVSLRVRQAQYDRRFGPGAQLVRVGCSPRSAQHEYARSRSINGLYALGSTPRCPRSIATGAASSL